MYPNFKYQTQADYFKAFNSMLEECTSLIIQSNESNFHSSLDKILEKIGLFSGVDRAYFFTLDLFKKTCSNVNEWCKEGVEPQIEYLQDVPFALTPNWMEKMMCGEEIYIDDLHALDEKWNPEKEILGPQGIQSLLSLPVRESEQFFGFIGFDAVEYKIKWNDDSRHLLSILANNIGSVIRRNIQSRELQSKIDELTKLHHQNKTFISVINHDVFAPIKHVNIVGSRIMKQSSELTKEDLLDQLTHIVNSTKRMELLCANILKSIKSEDNQIFDKQIEPVNMKQLLEELKDYLFISLLVHQNTLSYQVSGDNLIFINRNVINVILTNLVNNANRFTKNGEIKIDCDFTSDIKTIRVQDDGRGMSSATLSKLRSGKIVIGNRDNPELSGYGIGYSLIFKMLELINGSIDIDSEQGKGTTITLRWPIKE